MEATYKSIAEHMSVLLKKKERTRVSPEGVIYCGLIERDTPYPSHLFSGEAVHRLLGQDAVDLAQPFPVYTNTIVRLLLGCTVDSINPGFKVVMLAFQKV